MAAILELGAAFHPEFSGRENIELFGKLYGMEKGAVRARATALLESVLAEGIHPALSELPREQVLAELEGMFA